MKCAACGYINKELTDVEKTKKRIIDEIKALDKKNDGFNYQDRLDILREFCRGCGDDDPRCQCQNDE